MNAVEHQAAAMPVLTHVVEHRSDQAFIRGERMIDARLWQQVTGDLLTHELIETGVVVEGTDQIVAILMRALGGVVPFVTVSVRVAHHVHPVTGKVLAELRTGQQPVDLRFQA